MWLYRNIARRKNPDNGRRIVRDQLAGASQAPRLMSCSRQIFLWASTGSSAALNRVSVILFSVAEAIITNLREALWLLLHLINAALLVGGFIPELGFFADFLFTYIINLNGWKLYRDGRGGGGLGSLFCVLMSLKRWVRAAYGHVKRPLPTSDKRSILNSSTQDICSR